MIHQGEDLPLRLEPGDHTFRVHARFDDLQGDSAPNRSVLLGHVNHPAASLADLLQKPVLANSVSGRLAAWNTRSGFCGFRRRLLEKITESGMSLQQRLDSLAQFTITVANALQKCSAFTGGQLDGRGKKSPGPDAERRSYTDARHHHNQANHLNQSSCHQTAASGQCMAKIMANQHIKTNEISRPKGQRHLRNPPHPGQQ